jgi:hypothetical protein
VRPSRRHGLLAGAFLLYAGALLIAAAGAGPAAIAVTLALLMLYTVLMRPAVQWSGPGPAGLSRLALTVAVLGLLAALLWGAGAALAAVFGPLPLPVWAGVGVAVVGIALSRGVWSARREAEMNDLLEDALTRLKGFDAGAAADAGARRAATEAEDEALWAKVNATLDSMAGRIARGEPVTAEIDRLARLTITDEIWQELAEHADGSAGWERARLDFLAHPAIGALAITQWDVEGCLARAFAMPDPALHVHAIAAARAWADHPDAWVEDAGSMRAALAPWLDRLAADGGPQGRREGLAAFLEAATLLAAAAVEHERAGHAADDPAYVATEAALEPLREGMDDAAMAAVLGRLPPEGFRAAAQVLDLRARAGDRAAARAMILHATRPGVAAALAGRSPALLAFERAGPDAALVALFCARAGAMLARNPALADALPWPGAFRARAQAVPEQAEALHALAAAAAAARGGAVP